VSEKPTTIVFRAEKTSESHIKITASIPGGSLPELEIIMPRENVRRLGAGLVCVSDDVDAINVKLHGTMERFL
jgi:hypothetical protein